MIKPAWAGARLFRRDQFGRQLLRNLDFPLAQPIVQTPLRLLPQQGQLGVPAVTSIGQVVPDELAQPEPFIQLSNHQQASIGGDS